MQETRCLKIQQHLNLLKQKSIDSHVEFYLRYIQSFKLHNVIAGQSKYMFTSNLWLLSSTVFSFNLNVWCCSSMSISIDKGSSGSGRSTPTSPRSLTSPLSPEESWQSSCQSPSPRAQSPVQNGHTQVGVLRLCQMASLRAEQRSLVATGRTVGFCNKTFWALKCSFFGVCYHSKAGYYISCYFRMIVPPMATLNRRPNLHLSGRAPGPYPSG